MTPVSAATAAGMSRGRIRVSSSWMSRVSSSDSPERSRPRPRKKLAMAAAPPINAGMIRASSCWVVEGDKGQIVKMW